MQPKSLLIPIALLSAGTAVNAQQTANQIAFFPPGSNQCQPDSMLTFTRSVMPEAECKERLSNSLNMTMGASCVPQGIVPVSLSCIPDILAMPKNSQGNPYMVQQFFDTADCKGNLIGLGGFQTNMIGRAPNSTNPTTLATCIPGSQIQLLQCASIDRASCVPYEKIENGQCMQMPEQNQASGSSIKSIKYVCVASGASAPQTSSANGALSFAASLLLTPLALLVTIF